MSKCRSCELAKLESTANAKKDEILHNLEKLSKKEISLVFKKIHGFEHSSEQHMRSWVKRIASRYPFVIYMVAMSVGIMLTSTAFDVPEWCTLTALGSAKLLGWGLLLTGHLRVDEQGKLR
jgi:hypothetical protein